MSQPLNRCSGWELVATVAFRVRFWASILLVGAGLTLRAAAAMPDEASRASSDAWYDPHSPNASGQPWMTPPAPIGPVGEAPHTPGSFPAFGEPIRYTIPGPTDFIGESNRRAAHESIQVPAPALDPHAPPHGPHLLESSEPVFGEAEPVTRGSSEWISEPFAVYTTPNSVDPLWNGDTDDTSASRIGWVIGNDNGLGWFGLESQGVLGYWGPERFNTGFGYSVYFLEGPTRSDLPPRLFGLNYGLRWRDRLTSRWSYEVAVAPGIYSDFEDSARDGIRIQGHGFGMWTVENFQVVLGIDYLDRENLALLPIAGFVWAPDDVTRIDLVFPRPRFARLIRRGDASDAWCYVSGEYGGDSWAIERHATGLADVATLNEIRIALGVETLRASGLSSVFEIVLHVDRELVYASGNGDFAPSSTFGLRAGSAF